MSDFLLRPRLNKLAIIRRVVPLQQAAPEKLTLRLVMSRVAQSFRLMVGVQDYPTYLRHMHQRHPDVTPMTEKQFHRYCLEARFPATGGKMGKCPC